ncbi:MAG TPA: hypothetical protein VL728_07330 [Cyclobacteriaceae bacterium]|nr:hypothetical protein [Cyclobacteriaceae bacterium]
MQLKLMAIALFLMISTAYVSYGAEKPVLSVTRKDSSNVYVVNYTDRKPGKVILTIKDSQGHALVRRQIHNQTGFSMPVNLSSVAMGIYTVYTENGTDKQSVQIDYNNDTAPTYSRIVNLGENRYLFTTTHVGKETITITIYDGNDVNIFRENRTIDGIYSTIYNLQNVVGEPSFEVSETSGNSLMVPGNPLITVIDKSKKQKE